MKNYKLTIAYDGSRYKGWQRLGDEPMTIQHIVEEAIGEIVGCPVEISGSGRTDGGVHAAGQTANVKLRERRNPGQLCRELNDRLPEDIRVKRAEIVRTDFHSRFDAVSKVYEYRVDCREKADVFARKYSYHFGKPLDVEAMRRAAGYLTGTHDFTAFTDKKEGKRAGNVRTIYAVEIIPGKERVLLRFCGDGFLYHEVRILAGTLIEAGSGVRTAESVREALLAKDRQQTGFLAPAHGLCLREVRYE